MAVQRVGQLRATMLAAFRLGRNLASRFLLKYALAE
jgi:hypothetical protein